MLAPFVHEAVLAVSGNSDDAAPGAAVTLELCGSIEHPPPCPLAPHNTRAEQTGETLRVRVVFATQPENEEQVRKRIEKALRTGSVTRPDGTEARWDFLEGTAATLSPSEAALADRLAGLP
jgi:hypothetical protein